MKASERNSRVWRAYGITAITHIRNISAEVKAEYRIDFNRGEPLTVKVPLCGHTESTVLSAAIVQLNQRPVTYRT